MSDSVSFFSSLAFYHPSARTNLFAGLIAATLAAIGGCDPGSAAADDEDKHESVDPDKVYTSVLSSEMEDEIFKDEQFQRTISVLHQQGEVPDVENAVVYRQYGLSGHFEVLFPVVSMESGLSGKYVDLGFQRASDGSIVVYLVENEELFDTPDDTQFRLGTCSAYGPWETVSSYCDWQLICLGEATMLHRQRKRTCYYNGSSWPEYQNTTVRNKCGC